MMSLESFILLLKNILKRMSLDNVIYYHSQRSGYYSGQRSMVKAETS